MDNTLSFCWNKVVLLLISLRALHSQKISQRHTANTANGQEATARKVVAKTLHTRILLGHFFEMWKQKKSAANTILLG
ncbi:MAG TPA: hypothetical protein DCF63_06470 [Planctomycetaceae bacterium]|nr:hypothetical protein [Planctomycetaceae bacterium]